MHPLWGSTFFKKSPKSIDPCENNSGVKSLSEWYEKS